MKDQLMQLQILLTFVDPELANYLGLSLSTCRAKHCHFYRVLMLIYLFNLSLFNGHRVLGAASTSTGMLYGTLLICIFNVTSGTTNLISSSSHLSFFKNSCQVQLYTKFIHT